jgi:hypothetical protein
MPRNGEDVLRSLRHITERSAKGGDVLGQVVVADEAVGPHELHQLVFLHDAITSRDEHT